MYAKRLDSEVASSLLRTWTGRRRPWAAPGRSMSAGARNGRAASAAKSKRLPVSRSRPLRPGPRQWTIPPCAEPWRAGPMKKIADAGLLIGFLDRLDKHTMTTRWTWHACWRPAGGAPPRQRGLYCGPSRLQHLPQDGASLSLASSRIRLHQQKLSLCERKALPRSCWVGLLRPWADV